MNYLNLRKGPNLTSIVGEHRSQFEQDVLENYFTACEFNLGYEGWIPSVDANILPALSQKYMLAILWGDAHRDPSYFHNLTHGKFIDDLNLELWVVANLQKIREHGGLGNLADAAIDVGNDLLCVLDYYHMVYHAGSENQSVIMNMPTREVW